MRPITDPAIRFWRKVDKSAGPEACWLWGGAVAGTKTKYGQFRPGTRSTDPKVYSHRYSYELAHGPIPAGHQVDHVKARGCTSILCVNPLHLEAVVEAVNHERQRTSVCRAGHDLSNPDNAVWDDRGRRRGCAICKPNLKRHYERKVA